MSARPLGFAAVLLCACCGAASAYAAVVPIEVRHAYPPNWAARVPNRLYVTVEVCDADGTCVNVPDVVVDTSSAGLRVNRAALGALRLAELNDVVTGAPLRACARLAQGSIWGNVVRAQVRLGALSTRWAIPIQTYTVQTGRGDYFDAPAECGSRAQDLAQNGALAGNGVLGIGPQRNDCQFSVLPGGTELAYSAQRVDACPLTPGDARYFLATLDGWVPLDPHWSQRLPNPVVALPVGHDDGVVLQLDGPILDAGRPSVSGRLGLGFDASTLELFNAKPRALPFEPWPTLPIKVDGELVQAELCSTAQCVEFNAEQARHFGIDRATVECPRELQLDFEPVAPDWLELLRNPVLAQRQPPPRLPASLRLVDTARSSMNPAWWRNAAQPCATAINPSDQPVVTLGLPFFFGRTIGIGLPSSEYPRGYLLY